MPLAEVTEKYSDFNVTCSTFQCYLLLKCSKWDKISLVKVAKSHPKYEDHHFKIIPLNNLPLSVHFSNDGMSSGQQVGKYGVKMKDDTYLDNIYLSIQLMSNYSLGSYNGINCTYGGILVLEELESQQYVIRHRLCGSQTGAFRDELALTMTGQTVILVFYYYKGFGKIMADIQIKFSQCVGIFLDPMKGVQCRYPVHCDLIYDKCLFKDVLNISYPKETCFHIQYIDNPLFYMNKRMFQMTVSGFFNNVQMANKLIIAHTNSLKLTTKQVYRQHTKQTIMEDIITLHAAGGEVNVSHLVPEQSDYSHKDRSFYIRSHHISCIQNCSKLFKGFDYTELHFCDLCKASYFFQLNREDYLLPADTYSILFLDNKCATNSKVNITVIQLQLPLWLCVIETQYIKRNEPIHFYSNYITKTQFVVPQN